MTRLCPILSNIHVNHGKKSCRDASAKFWTRYSINVVNSSNARLCRSFFQPTNVWITFMIRGIPNPVITFVFVLAFSLAIKGCCNILYFSRNFSGLESIAILARIIAFEPTMVRAIMSLRAIPCEKIAALFVSASFLTFFRSQYVCIIGDAVRALWNSLVSHVQLKASIHMMHNQSKNQNLGKTHLIHEFNLIFLGI